MKKTLFTILKLIGYGIAVVVIDICLMGLSKLAIGDWVSTVIPNGSEIFHEALFLLLSIGIVNTGLALIFKSFPVKSGWPSISVCFKWFWIGGIAGVSAAGGMLILTVVTGGGQIIFQEAAVTDYILTVLPLLGILLLSALSEEWFFRGVPLTLLSQATGRGWANIVFALLFAVAHLGSAGMNWLVFINVVIGGMIVGALRFTKGGIPTAWGFHFAWNSTQVLSGVTLTGEHLTVPGIQFISTGHVLFSGGELGPEGGVGAFVITTALLILIGKYYLNKGVTDLPIPRFQRNSKIK